MRWLRLFMVICLFPLAGCAMNTTSATYLVEATGPYLLDSGDVVRVTVYGEEDLSNTYRVDDSGELSMPLVGTVAVRGVTSDVAARRITSQLANGFIRNPNVAVEVAEYRPFFIQGAVSTPNRYAYEYGMTVRAAISTAGGHTDTADRTGATIYRRQEGEMVKGTVGLDFPIKPGDIIVVSERWL